MSCAGPCGDSKTALKGWSTADWERLGGEYAAVEDGMAKALADELPADSEAVRSLIRRRHAWVAVMWNRTPTREA